MQRPEELAVSGFPNHDLVARITNSDGIEIRNHLYGKNACERLAKHGLSKDCSLEANVAQRQISQETLTDRQVRAVDIGQPSLSVG